MSTIKKSLFYFVLTSFFLSLGFMTTLSIPAQAGQIAQSDKEKPKPIEEEEEHNDEDDC